MKKISDTSPVEFLKPNLVSLASALVMNTTSSTAVATDSHTASQMICSFEGFALAFFVLTRSSTSISVNKDSLEYTHYFGILD